jgi:hypothetical protein
LTGTPVHLELTQVLTCPHCGPPNGLIAFVDRMEGRRIVEGRLDCPVCERRHMVRGGTVLLGEAAEVGGDAAGDDLAPAAAALLGLPEGPEILLLAGGAESLAPTIADLRPEAAVVTFGAAPTAPHPRVYPIVPAPGESAGPHLPFRAGSFAGAVLTRAGSDLVADIAAGLEAEARLVVLAPREGAAGHGAPLLRELASDARAWVGVRV